MKTIINIAIALSIAFLAGCFSSVDTGEAGMKVQFGEIVSKKPLDEGLYFYPPWVSLVTYDCRNHKVEITTETFTKDVQYSKIQLAVTYSLDKNKVIDLHQETGPQFVNVVLQPAIVGMLKDTIGTWEAGEIMANREKITSSISANLQKKIDHYGILVRQVELVNIDFSDEFEKAVENKQIAVQRATEAKNRTVQIEEESRQKIITAEAEAKAMEVRAKALEKNKSVLLIDFIQKWDGKLPNYLSTGNGAIPILDIDKMKN